MKGNQWAIRFVAMLAVSVVICGRHALAGSGEVYDGLRSSSHSVAIGDSHICAIAPDEGSIQNGIRFFGDSDESEGQVYCWGKGSYGRLGTGDSTDRSTAFAVLDDRSNPLRGVTSISGGGAHTCAVTRGGDLYCWGYNESRALGVPVTEQTKSFSAYAVKVPRPIDGQGWRAVAAGKAHTCAIFGDQSAVYCWGGWGSTSGGATGTAGGFDGPYPIHWPIGEGFTYMKDAEMIVAGAEHSCAVVKLDSAGNNRVFCWGSNQYRQLGSAGMTYSTTPLQITNPSTTQLNRVTSISSSWSSDSTCLLNHNGATGKEMWCWGSDRYGEITGRRSDQPIGTPIKVGGNRDALVSGGTYTCSLRRGYSSCVGITLVAIPSSYWSYGIPDYESTSFEAPFIAEGRIKEIYAGPNNTCVKAEGRLICTGLNSYGQRGLGFITPNGSGAPNPLPAAVLGFRAFAQEPLLAAGRNHACVVRSQSSDGYQRGLYCWGDVMGNGVIETAPKRMFPALYPMTSPSGGLSRILSIKAGFDHTCALTGDNTGRNVHCWGRNAAGQLGSSSPTATSNPAVFTKDRSITKVATGDMLSCAIKGMEVYCWGSNSDGALGRGETFLGLADFQPAKVVGLTYVEDIAISNVPGVPGANTVCALNGGVVYCWGNNAFRAFPLLAADGKTGKHSSIPVKVQYTQTNELLFPKSIAAGDGRFCGNTDYGVYCWGRRTTDGKPVRVPNALPATHDLSVGRNLKLCYTSAKTGNLECCTSQDNNLWGQDATCVAESYLNQPIQNHWYFSQGPNTTGLLFGGQGAAFSSDSNIKLNSGSSELNTFMSTNRLPYPNQ